MTVYGLEKIVVMRSIPSFLRDSIMALVEFYVKFRRSYPYWLLSVNLVNKRYMQYRFLL